MLRYHLQLQWSTCQLRLYYQEGGSRLQPSWGSSINFIGLGCARLMLRVNEKGEGNQIALTDTSILLRAWLASLDSLTLIWYISPRLKARYINGRSNAYGDYLPLLPKPFNNLPGAGNQSLATCEIW